VTGRHGETERKEGIVEWWNGGDEKRKNGIMEYWNGGMMGKKPRA
jgi:hypothetical protein